MTIVLVYCPDCNGSASQQNGAACDGCLAQGHIAINRTHDGKIPTHFETGEVVREWLPPTLPETPENPLVLLYRCIP